MAGHRRNAAGVVIAGMAMIGAMAILLFDGRPDGANLTAVDSPVGEAGVVIPSTPLQPEQIERRRGIEPGTPRIVNPSADNQPRPIPIIEPPTPRNAQSTTESRDTAALPLGCIREFRGHTDWISAVATNGNGDVVSASIDHTVRQWPENRDQPANIVATFDQVPVGMSIGNDGQRGVWLLANGSVMSSVCDGEIGKPETCAWAKSSATCVATVGPAIVVGSAQGWLVVANWADQRVIADKQVSPMRIVDIVGIESADSHALRFAFADAAGKVFEAEVDQAGDTFDLTVDQPFATSPVPIAALAFSLGANAIIGGGRDGIIRVWSRENGKIVRELHGHIGWVNDLAVSPDGRFLASAGADRFVRVWRLTDGAEIHTFEGNKGPVSAVIWRPDSRRLISAGGAGDPVLREWELPK